MYRTICSCSRHRHDHPGCTALQVTALAWRPHGGMMLAVACADGICLWTLSRGLARHAARGFTCSGRYIPPVHALLHHASCFSSGGSLNEQALQPADARAAYRSCSNR